MTKLKALEDLFEEQLQDIYFAENKLLKALPKMAKKACSPELSAAFLKHEKETGDQISKLERVMKSLEITVKGKKCPAILGIIEEAEELMKEAANDETMDAALIAAGQKAEHYEIATYGSLCSFANRLGHTKEAEILHSILEQEKMTDEALTDIAESGVNDAAIAANGSEKSSRAGIFG